MLRQIVAINKNIIQIDYINYINKLSQRLINIDLESRRYID